MAVIADFTLPLQNNGILTVPMTPPTAVGGWSLTFVMNRNYGMPLTSGLVTKSCASGYGNGVSGITVINSGQGIVQVAFNPAEVSGLPFGNYACRMERTDPGLETTIYEGFRLGVP